MKKQDLFFMYCISISPLLLCATNPYSQIPSTVSISSSIQNFIQYLGSFIIGKTDPYSNISAQVRISSALNQAEQQFLNTRQARSKQVLQKLLGTTLTNTQIPRIALCGSGGGYRALICAMATLDGLESLGLLDTLTYMVGLSGSAWTFTSWLEHDASMSSLKQATRQRLSQPIESGFQAKQLLEDATLKASYGQPFSLMDIWGAFISNTLLGDLKNSWFGTSKLQKFSQLQTAITAGNAPLIINTAAMPLATPDTYEWFEFTPYEIGSIQSQTYVPAWAFGRKFNGGISINNAPESYIDFYMGIWGSSFSVSMTELLQKYASELPTELYKILDEIIGNPEIGLGNFRLSPASVLNFAYNIDGHPWQQNQEIVLIDAGLDFNIPAPPILRLERAIDIILICDASTTVTGAPELKFVQEYAQQNKLKFPKINYENIDQSIISVFKDDIDPTVPVVIYMPRIKNKNYSQTFDPTESINSGGFCSTPNPKYTTEQFDELYGLIKYNVTASGPIIIDAIKSVIQAKK